MKTSNDHQLRARPSAPSKNSTWTTIWVCAAGGGILAGAFGLGAAFLGAIAGGLFGLYASRRDAR